MITHKERMIKLGRYVKKKDRKEKELSKLDRDCIEAKKLGLSYGQYKGQIYERWSRAYLKGLKIKNSLAGGKNE